MGGGSKGIEPTKKEERFHFGGLIVNGNRIGEYKSHVVCFDW